MGESGDGAGTGLGSGSKPASSFESTGGRLRFTVELRSNETTIVSWKKLLRESNSNKHNVPGPSVPVPFSEDHQQSIPQDFPAHAPTGSPSTKQNAENEAKDSQTQAGSNRLSNVIERIERMYAGNSTDEEDVVLDDIPDDDDYDTEDSFIDDTELDDYFQVDNSAIKHDGFFVNRGKLERIEPTVSANEQPKKRRRKDITKGHGESEDGHTPSKHAKIGNKGRKALSLMERKSSSELQGVAVPTMHNENVRFQASPQNAEVLLNKKTAATKVTRQDKNTDELRTGVPSSKNHNNKKDTKVQNTSSQRLSDKDSHLNKSHSGKQRNSANELYQSSQSKEKGRHVERFDLNVTTNMDSMPTPKVPVIQKKYGSNIRPKSSNLDKAIRELEKIVAESRPSSAEVQEPDNSSLGVKRRLSPEIKQKLAKVARFTQASYGKIPKDVINRLMNIVGHLMQLRTLTRNLKIMANMGLSSKQEKDDGVRKIKQEVAEMVNLHISHIKSKSGQSAPDSDDFQEAGPEEKEGLNQRFNMDDALENKIYDLYDLYVERLEEHSGPPIRKLYEELAALWPSGAVHTDAIKSAIFRAKDRRKALGIRRQDQEKIKKRKVATPKAAEDTTKTDAFTQASNINEKVTSKLVPSVTQGSNIHEKVTNKTVPSAVDPRLPAAFSNSPNIEKPKKEKS